MSRGRVQDTTYQENINHLQIWGSCAQSAWTTTSTAKSAKLGEYRSMTDEVIPQFHLRKARGEIFFNPMTLIKQTASISPGNSNHRRRIATQNCSGIIRQTEVKSSRTLIDLHYNSLFGYTYNGFSSPAFLLSQDDINDAFSEVSTRVASERGRSEGNLYEAIAESQKTLRILPDLVRKGSGILRRSKREVELAKAHSNGRTAGYRARIVAKLAKTKDANNQRLIDDLLGGYLAIQYGIMPVVREMHNVMNAYGKKYERVRETTRSFATLGLRSDQTKTTSYASGSDTVLAQFSDLMRFRAMSLDEYNADLAFRSGFSMKNLITLPWELVRFSFIIDNFINVGDVLGAYAPSPFVNGLGGCVVTERLLTVNALAAGSTGAAGVWELVSPQSGSYHSTLDIKTRTRGISPGQLVIRNDFRLRDIQKTVNYLAVALVNLRALK